MPKNQYSVAETILNHLLNPRALVPRPFESLELWTVRLNPKSKAQYRQAARRLQSKGLLKLTKKNGEIFVQLTQNGQLEALFLKSALPRPKVWDGKWRLFMFDVPESSKEKRTVLRKLLRQNNYYKLQASVYISPYPLNREAVAFLNNSGLRNYIRIIKVEELDYDGDLLKRFNLNKT